MNNEDKLLKCKGGEERTEEKTKRSAERKYCRVGPTYLNINFINYLFYFSFEGGCLSLKRQTKFLVINYSVAFIFGKKIK